jgi:hypothetical protein
MPDDQLSNPGDLQSYAAQLEQARSILEADDAGLLALIENGDVTTQSGDVQPSWYIAYKTMI